MTGRVLSRPIAVSDVRGQVEREIAASAEECVRIAAAYGVSEVRGLSATATLTAGPGGSIDVNGRVVADIVQPCVVSLVPVAQHIDEPFAVRFVPPGSPELPGPVRPHEEVVIDPAAPDPPEALTGSSVDLGAVVEEAFVLAIDPYPRAPDAVLPAEAVGDGDKPDSPFAVLARLKSAGD